MSENGEWVGLFMATADECVFQVAKSVVSQAVGSVQS